MNALKNPAEAKYESAKSKQLGGMKVVSAKLATDPILVDNSGHKGGANRDRDGGSKSGVPLFGILEPKPIKVQSSRPAVDIGNAVRPESQNPSGSIRERIEELRQRLKAISKTLFNDRNLPDSKKAQRVALRVRDWLASLDGRSHKDASGMVHKQRLAKLEAGETWWDWDKTQQMLVERSLKETLRVSDY